MRNAVCTAGLVTSCFPKSIRFPCGEIDAREVTAGSHQVEGSRLQSIPRSILITHWWTVIWAQYSEENPLDGIYIYKSNIAIRIHPTFLQYGPGSVFPETCGVELGTQKSNFRWVLFLGSALLPCIAIWVTEGSLEVKLAPVWTDGKSQRRQEKRREETRREEKRREERRREEKRSEAKRREEKRREEKRREEKKREDQKRERVRRKKMHLRENVKKMAKHCVFPMFCGSRGSKSRLAKAAGAEPSGGMRE